MSHHSMQKWIAMLSVVVGAASAFNAAGRERNECPGGRELKLVNGRFHTMDRAGNVVSSVTIRNGRFAVVGHDRGGGSDDDCTQVVNLQGRTVLPGLVDNHNHILLLGLRPGYHVPLENASSIAEALDILHQRASQAPAGQFVTTIGGFNPVQFAEKRLPTLQELDTIAPNNPVYVQSMADALLHGDREE